MKIKNSLLSIVFSITIFLLIAACSSAKKKTERNKSEMQKSLTEIAKKDSISSQKKENISSTTTKNDSLNSVKKDELESSTETETNIKYKPEIDPETGKFKPFNYEEKKDGKVKTSISINGSGEVTIKSVSSQKEKSSNFENTYKKEFSETEKEKYNSEANTKVNNYDQSNYKENIKSESETIQKNNTGFSFWTKFWIVFWIFIIILVIIVLKKINNKFNLAAKTTSIIKNFFT